jgi:hypothetical protein
MFYEFKPDSWALYLNEWPGIICTEDMCNLQSIGPRPPGYNVPILLMFKLELRWAALQELSEFVPKPLEDMSKELRTAFEDVYRAWDNNWGLAHWKTVMAAADSEDNVDTPAWRPAPAQEQAGPSRTKKRQRPAIPIPTHKRPRYKFSPSSEPEGLALDMTRLNGNAAPEITQQDDLKADTGIVTIHIGPDDEEFMVPRESITDRPYFRDIQSLENEAWVIRRSSYRDVDPKKFKWIADFLSTGDFGHRIPTDEWERKETIEESRQDIFIECAEAYEVAKDMVMEDLMDLILEKLQAIKPWAPLDALSFATLIFQDPTDASCRSEAETNLMKSFGNYLAQRFWYFDEQHHSNWKERLKRCPGMAREVFSILAEKAERKLQDESQEDASSSGGESSGDEKKWSYALK